MLETSISKYESFLRGAEVEAEADVEGDEVATEECCGDCCCETEEATVVEPTNEVEE